MVYHFAFFSQGYLSFHLHEHHPETHDIFKRFGKVFEQTYTRFLDLQKAEAQAREAQIETTLEKVRSHTMGMRSSEDLAPVAAVMFDQMRILGGDLFSFGIVLCDKHEDMVEQRQSVPDAGMLAPFFVPVNLDYIHKYRYDQWKAGVELFSIEIPEDYIAHHFELMLELPSVKAVWEGIAAQGIPLPPIPTWEIDYGASFRYGYLLVSALKPFEEVKIFPRFAKVFEQAYTRFLDLQKAEAQAREARIEIALEKIRSRTMAMQHSDELPEAANLLFLEVQALGIPAWSCGYNVLAEDKKTSDCWMSSEGAIQEPFTLYFTEEASFIEWYKFLQSAENFYVQELGGKYLEEHYNYMRNIPKLGEVIKKLEDAGISLPTYQINHLCKFTSGFLLFITYEPVPDAHDIFKRFTKVFEQTYTRFLDLEKAEAQAREAKIEAALERVRSKAMSMHSSEDLTTTIGVLYRELESLHITPRRCGLGLLNKETHMAEISTMNTTEQGDSIEVIGKLKMVGHPVLEGIYDNWVLQKEYHPVLRGNEIREYYQLIRPQIGFPDYPNDAVQYGYFFFFNEGGVYAWTEKEMIEGELQIHRRFTTVLSLTYKRYIDLKQAEGSAREAIKQAALDRVRAEIASMRTTHDLEKITPLVWNELTILGVPFIRCGVFIMDDAQKLIHTFLSTPEGKAIAAFHIPYTTPGNIAQVLNHWYGKKNYIAHWDEDAFTEFAGMLVKQGGLDSSKEYLKTIPHGGFYLHFLPFLQGMLYVGNTAQLNEDDIKLIQSVADAFSTAYARYEDFNKLEAAKQQVDKTLIDLKQAQRQLVQSEKMASLGELTAGIAHEIQNPLNFINNFSEVNTELIEDLKAELATGNQQEAISIAHVIKENEQKINHHGKRADAIVKGMLQHSRASAGKKALTDINALADEYLRLCYHGLRAKDKSFNATFETHLDETLEKVNVIPQDIGRVLLNLFTNAFYAVSQKKKLDIDLYEPTVTVTTKRIGDKIEIQVADNGNGIPQKILDKIFQPFFTTKPTGQGTGLGLSLSYDIITKGHGGELKVETKEGAGTEFVIQLPFK
jgi:signal transduction histidine kinase